MDVIKLCNIRGIHCVGTLRRNRVGVPKDLLYPETGAKKDRGECESWKLKDDNIEVYFTAWQDNKPVHFFSTYAPKKTHFLRKTSAKDAPSHELRVEGPTIVDHYIRGMRGTDLLDQCVSYYSYLHRSVKWTRRIFTHFLLVAVNNAHILQNRQFSTDTSLSDFLETLIEEMFAESGVSVSVDGNDSLEVESLERSLDNSASLLGKRSAKANSGLSERNFVEGIHFPIREPHASSDTKRYKQARCILCSGETTIFCGSCGDALCVDLKKNSNCFVEHMTKAKEQAESQGRRSK